MWRNNLDIQKKALLLHSVFETDGSLAQLVEHIPFKDGVLGSSPKRATKYKGSCFSAAFFVVWNNQEDETVMLGISVE